MTRRPLKSREAGWAVGMADWLARAGVRPNAISAAGMVFAGGAAVALLAAVGRSGASGSMLLLAAAAAIQLRLLCNLLDGMVADRRPAGRRSKSGEIWNDFPDRVSDLIILVATGYALPVGWGRELGWVAGTLAVLTAYARVLGQACAAAASFVGPMAKPHRMAAMTVACVLAAGETAFGWPRRALAAGLAVVAAGSLLTLARRLRLIVRDLEG